MKKIPKPNKTDLAVYAAILTSAEYYDEVLKVVNSGDQGAFDNICDNAGIPRQAWKDLWAAAIGTQSAEAQAAMTVPGGW